MVCGISMRFKIATHSSILAWRILWTRSLAGCSPWGHRESDVTEWLAFSLWDREGQDGGSGTAPPCLWDLRLTP